MSNLKTNQLMMFGPEQVRISGSFAFDGVDDHLDLGAILQTTVGGADAQFSIALHMQKKGTGTSKTVVSKGTSGVDGNVVWNLQFNPSNQLEFQFWGGTTATQNATVRFDTIINEEMINHIVLAYDGTIDTAPEDRLELYVNGAVSTKTPISSAGFPFDTTGVGSGSIRVADFNGVAQNIEADIGNFGFYQIVLSAGNVTRLYNKGNPLDLRDCAFASDLVGYWKLNDDTNFPTENDLSANTNNGTLTNAVIGSYNTRAIATTEGYSSVSFDGVDDYLTGGNILDSVFAGAGSKFTISFWVKSPDFGVSNNFIIGRWQEGVAEQWRIYHDSATIRFEAKVFGAPSTTRIIVGARVPINNTDWYHYTVAWDGTELDTSRRVRVYVNGLEYFGQLLGLGNFPFDIISSTADFQVMGNLVPGFYTGGNIDNIGIWNTQLDPGQCVELYGLNENRGSVVDYRRLPTAGNLAAYWKVGEGDTFPTVRNILNPGTNDLTMTNMVAGDIVTDVPGV